ncbi:MAG: GAF domain-containing protein [Deltaproteobacteria bacterium]|nr:GAF domain-containing protein [Deltaproteobacteria bacterium]
MESTKVDDHKVKFVCSCGFTAYSPGATASKAINPNYSKDSLVDLKFDNTGEFYFEAQRADRENMEILTLQEISMLASSDYDLGEELKGVAEKTAKRLGVDVCSIYLWDSECERLVLRGTYGLSQNAVGKASLKIGEGVTGTTVKEKAPVLVTDISTDERYKFFPETKEEQYKLKTMYSYPIFSGAEPYGVLNVQTVVIREFKEDEIYFISVITNLILGAVKMRKNR